jgi:protease I
MKKVAILVDEQYQVLEVWYPYLRLKEAGIEAVIVGREKKQYASKEGYPISADADIGDVNADDLSGVIVPGGWAPDFLRRSEAVNNLVRAVFVQKKLVAGICHAGWVLASANVLGGKKATAFFAIKDDVINAGASFIDKEVVVDGNLITSRNPFDLPYFCAEIINFLRNNQ